MNLPETIYAHAQALPADLQREALDFIAWLERRYAIKPPATGVLATEAFIQRFAGSIGSDFPDDIGDSGLAGDMQREAIE